MASERVLLVVDGDGWPGVAAARSLARAGWTVAAPRGSKLARTRLCRHEVEIPPAPKDVDGFAEAVAAAIRRHGVEMVAAAEDSTLTLLYEREGLLGDAAVLGGDRASAAIALDKAETLRRAVEAGFPTPPFVLPERLEDVEAAARAVGLPCSVKPRRSYARHGNRLVHRRHTIARTPAEARRAAERYVGEGFELPLVEQWIDGRSLGVAAVLRGGRVLGWGARAAVSQWPVAGGLAIRRRTVGEEVPGVRGALELLQAIGFEGMGDVQYLIDRDGSPRLMEVGARIYGWLPLTIAAGADLPLLHARALDGIAPDEPIAARTGVEMTWLLGELLRIWEVVHPRAVLPPGMTRLDVVRSAWPLRRPGLLYDGSGLREDASPIRRLRRFASVTVGRGL
jgi:biotin carboxylase